jgi:hypothetical protein
MSNIKVQVYMPSAENNVPLDPTKPTIEGHKVEQFLTSSANPLYNVKPPQQTEELQNAVLLQAEDIKKTLDRISKTDPTARRHNFPYSIATENEKLLKDNGFKLRKMQDGVTLEVYTEVSWDAATKWWMTIPLPSSEGNYIVNQTLNDAKEFAASLF